MSKVGRLDEALIVSRKLTELEPQNTGYLQLLGDSEWMAGNLEQAVSAEIRLWELAEPTLNEIPRGALENRVSVLHQSGRVNEAYDLVANCAKCSPETKTYVMALLDQVEKPDPNFQHEALKFKPSRYFTILTGRSDYYIDGVKDNFASGGYVFFYALGFNIGDTAADPRFKPMIIDSGLLRYWRARGWPKRCRPIGDDDFECGDIK